MLARKPLLSFYLLAYAITWSIGVPLMLDARGIVDWGLPHQLEWLAAFGPFIAAMLVARARFGRAGPRRILSSLGNLRAPMGWWLVALASPFLLLLLCWLVLWLMSGSMPRPAEGRMFELVTAAGFFDLVIVSGVIQGWGEEPGWRGFALPLLRHRFGSIAATFCLFPVWLFWHLPFFLARPEFGTAQFIGFSVGILSAAIWLTLIFDATRNLLLAVVWHSTVNIARGIALAFSMPMFLAISNAVLVGGLFILAYWLVKRPGPVADHGFEAGA